MQDKTTLKCLYENLFGIPSYTEVHPLRFRSGRTYVTRILRNRYCNIRTYECMHEYVCLCFIEK
jgi:hypothetical protein